MRLEGAVIGGDFRLERELARGGMGGVWIAEQLSTGQQRAVKLMHPTLIAQGRMRERFEQEARVGARIPSEHVVEVIAAGVDPEMGIPWLAMELLRGEDLAAFAARRGPLPAHELLPIFRQLCHALGAAHSVGVVHRDVKPENVFLANVHSAEASRQVKVLDFGIAKLAAEAKESGTGQVGTPLWMAPEQSEQHAAITPAADVWALGLIAFRLLSGRPYWRTANDPSATLSALFRETLMEPLVPASERARELGVEAFLPPGFDAWFARTVARDPAQRFPEANAAFLAFDALLSGATLPAPVIAAVSARPAAGASALPPRRASKAPVVLAAGGLLLLGGALVIALGAGAYLYLGLASEAAPVAAASSAAPAAGPAPAATPGPSAPATEPNAKPSGAGKPRAPATAVATADAGAPAAAPSLEPAAPAPAASGGAELKPIDLAAAQKKVNAAAAAAAVECAKFKKPGAASETFSGQRGFRPDGSATGGMSGDGGAQGCVKDKMFAVYYGKYSHPQEWHVETFAWSVTVK